MKKLLLALLLFIFGNQFVNAQNQLFPFTDVVAKTSAKIGSTQNDTFPKDLPHRIGRGLYAENNSGSSSTSYVNLPSTENTPNNNQRGIMFNITTTNEITINSFDHTLAGTTPLTFEIYYRVGGFSGSETTAADWTLVGSVAGLNPNNNNPGSTEQFSIPIPIDLTIPAGQTYGFYLTFTSTLGFVTYSNGSTTNDLLANDANLEIRGGVALDYPFIFSANNRLSSVVVHYNTQGDPAVLSTLTSADAANVQDTSADLGGNATEGGGFLISERGVVYAPTATNANPQIGGTGVTKEANGAGIGVFNETVSGLTAGTQYSYAAFATNGVGTAYGAVKVFTTSGSIPEVNLSVSANAGTEADGTVITVTATADAAVSGDQTLDIAVSGTGITGTDYTLSNTTITILDGQTTGTATFTVQDDADTESTETTTLTISNPSSGITLGSTTTQNITITDNDAIPCTEITASIGSASGTSSTVSPFYARNFSGLSHSIKKQYIYTAAELNAAGIFGGEIRQFSFDFTSTSPTTFADIEIKMGSTTRDSWVDPEDEYITGLQTVMNTASYTVNSAGFKDFVLDTPFNWDGTNNLIIEFCSGTLIGGNGTDNFARVSTETTATDRTLFLNQTNFTPGDACDATTGSRSSTRPVIQIVSCETTVSVGLSVSANAGTEAAGTNITVTATSAAAVSGDQTVDIGVSGTGITGIDYTLSNTTITILDGQTTGTVTFTVQDDADIEGTETATLTISNPSAGVSLSTTTQNVVITDDDFPSVDLSVSANAGTEAGMTAITVTATASQAVTGDQTVDLAVTGTGITGTDFTLSGTTITILNGATAGTATFTVQDDADVEGTETATITISNPSAGVSLGTTTQNVVITDDDFPSVDLSVSANAGTEAGMTAITVTATASQAVTGNQTVDLAVTGTGITGTDFTLSGTTITILNGVTTGSATFTVQDDADIEGTETATLTISNPSAGVSLGTTTQNVVITDDDFPSVNLSVSANVGTEADMTAITVTATASQAVTGNQTVDLAVTGTGITGTDFTLSGTTITILNGVTTGSATFTVQDDADIEGTEIASLTISNPSVGLTLGANTSEDVKITDNDFPTVEVSVSANAGTEVGTTAITVTATASKTVTGDQTVDIAASGTGITAGDFTLSATSITILNGATIGTVTFTVQDDTDIEGTEIASLTISNPSVGLTLGANTSEDIKITDDDFPSVEISVDVATGTEAAGTVITVTATASQAVDGDQTVDLGITGTGITATDYTLSNTTITILDGQTTGTVTFTVQDDTDIEGTEIASLTISNPSVGLTLGANTSEDVKITDNDFPTVEVSVSANAGTEAAGTVITVTATASQAVDGDQTVDLGVNGTGITGTDYTLSNTTITILDGQTTGTVTFTVQDDAAIEGTETATLTISNPSAGVSLGATTTQNIAITDNDFPSVEISVDVAAGTEAAGTAITVTATASQAVSGDQTIDLGVGGTGITGTDYTLNNTTITILDGQTTGSVTFTVQDDTDIEGTEIATLTMSNPSAGLILGTTITQNITITDNDFPTNITNVSSSKANGIYGVGESITIEVTFSNAVTITGIPQLSLETGTIDRIINYDSGSATNTLTFVYTVQAGDSTNDLDYTSTTALTLNSGTIIDGNTNDAILILPTPGAVNSLGANKGIAIDTAEPIFENSSPSVSDITQTSFRLQTDINEAGTIYFVMLTDGAVAPSSTEIKSGMGAGGASVLSDGNQSVNSGGFTHDFDISALSAGTNYDVYVVAEDILNNLQSTPIKIEITTLTKIDITIIGLTGVNKIYDGTTTGNSSGTASLSGVVSGDDVSLSGTPTFTFADKNVAANININISGYSLVGADIEKYNLLLPALSADITSKELTVNISADNKTYDGNTTVTVTLGTPALAGVLSGETVTISGTPSFAFTNKNVENNKAVTISGVYSLSGTDAGNYSLAQPTGLQANITQKPITITADAKTKVYGATDPTFTYQITTGSLETGDVLTGGLTRLAGEDVGTYIINQGTVDNTNYDITYVPDNLSITKAILNATADDKNKVQGQVNPTLTISYTGFVGTDTASDIDTPPTISTTATTASVTGNYPIALTGGLDNNYSFTLVDGTLTVGSLTSPTITFVNINKTYGDVDFNLNATSNSPGAITYSIVGTANGTNLSGTNNKTVSLGNAGSVTIRASQVADGTFSSVTKDITLSIAQKPITITADANSKAYGTADPTFTYQITTGSLEAGDVLTGDLTRLAGENVGNYVINQGTVDNTNYDITYVSDNLSITKAMLTATADDKNKVQGQVNPPLTISYTGFVGTDTASDIDTPPTISTTAITASVAGNYPITLTGGLDNNYSFTLVDGTLTVGSLTSPTITFVNINKTYGDADFNLNATSNSPGAITYSIVGTANGTNLSGTNNETVSLGNAGSVTIRASQVADGTFSSATKDITLSIAQKPITITADANNKVYGTADPTFTYQITTGSLETGDVLTGSLSRVTGEDVGSYAINQGTVDNTNYAITYISNNLNITKAMLTATADDKNKVQGQVNPPLTISYTGFVGTDNASDIDTPPTISTTATTVSVTGNYPIALTGGLDNNYSFTLVDGTLTVGSLTSPTITFVNISKTYGDADFNLNATSDSPGAITYSIVGTANGTNLSGTNNETVSLGNAVSVTIRASQVAGGAFSSATKDITLSIAQKTIEVTADSKTKVYGTTDPTFTYQITTGSLEAGDVLAGNLTRIAGEDVGIYAISSTLVNSNYVITYVPDNLTITQKSITVTADSKTKVYGTTDPALTYQITVGSLETGDVLIGNLSRVVGEDVGVYAISSTLVNSNYTITYVSDNLTISQKSITVTADSKTKVYGTTDPALTYQITAGSLETGDVLNGGINRVAGEDVGTYAINQGTLDNSNYAITYVSSILEIVKGAPITVTADSQTKVYNDSDPILTYQITGGTLVNGDVLTGSLSRVPGENIGTYAINQGSLDNSNYTITYVPDDLTITQKSITVTTDSKTKAYGAIDPALTYQITTGSLAAGDVLTGSLSRVVGEDIGTYAINQGTLDNSNYVITYVPDNLTITQKSITVTADPKTKVYGAVDPMLTYQITIGSLETGDVLTGNLTRVVGEDVGAYAISSTLANSNYVITYVPDDLTITQKSITVTADPKTKVYGAIDPALTYQITTGSLEAGDILTGGLNRVAGEDVGVYPINSTLANSNYAINFVSANLSITQKSITVAADSKTKAYGTIDPTFTYQITAGSLETGDVLNGGINRVAGEDVGTYAINQGTLDNSNYAITYVSSILEIVKGAPITVTADSQTKVYNDSDPIFTYQITGGTLVNGDVLTGSLSRVPGENIGTYVINQGSLDNINYTVIYISSELTITIPTDFEANMTNVFTPDNDGVNDLFEIKDLEKFYPNFKIIIYNRSGAMLFSYKHNGNPNDTPSWWDGTLKGTVLRTGVYYFSLNYNDGKTNPRSTWVYLKGKEN